jgi:hypothetical protein
MLLVHKSLIATELTVEEAQQVTDIVNVLPTDTGFVMQCPSLSLYWQFNLELVEHGNDILYLNRTRAGQWTVMWATDLHESKDSWSSVMLRKNLDEFRPLVMIGISPDRKDYTAIFFCNTREPNNPQPLVDDTTETGDMSMKRLMPGIEPLLQRHWAKHKLLKGVKTNDSLAALEAQVDLLTFWLLEYLPEDKRQKLLDAGVLKLKDEETLFDDVIAYKTRLRERQALYLATLSQYDNLRPENG